MNNSRIEPTIPNSNVEISFKTYDKEPVIISNVKPEQLTGDNVPTDFGWIEIVSSRFTGKKEIEYEGKKYRRSFIYIGEEISPEDFISNRKEYDGDAGYHSDLIQRSLSDYEVSFVALSTDIIPTKSGKPSVYIKGLHDKVCSTREDALEKAKDAIEEDTTAYHRQPK